MGKHTAPRSVARQATPPKPPPASGPANTHTHERAGVPTALRQVMVFGGLAVAVAVVALSWAGAGAVSALAIGAGLVVLGVILYLVLRRTGLLDGATAGSQSAADTAPMPHP